MSETGKSNNGVKAFAAVAVLAAVLTAMYFMTQPLTQRIDFMVVQITDYRDFMSAQIADLRDELKEHEAIPIHAGAAGNVAEFRQKFEEIETQFDWANDIANLRANHIERLLGLLWGETFQVELPGLDYWPLAGGEKK